jgi:hypothetical protein
MGSLLWLRTLLGIMLRPYNLPGKGFMAFWFRNGFLPSTEHSTSSIQMFDSLAVSANLVRNGLISQVNHMELNYDMIIILQHILYLYCIHDHFVK